MAETTNAPLAGKLDTVWRIIGRWHADLLPSYKLADLEHAAELYAADHPDATAQQIADWIVAPYVKPDVPIARAPSALLAQTWERLAQKYGRRYAQAAHAILRDVAESYADTNPDLTPRQLELWLLADMAPHWRELMSKPARERARYWRELGALKSTKKRTAK